MALPSVNTVNWQLRQVGWCCVLLVVVLQSARQLRQPPLADPDPHLRSVPALEPTRSLLLVELAELFSTRVKERLQWVRKLRNRLPLVHWQRNIAGKEAAGLLSVVRDCSSRSAVGCVEPIDVHEALGL